MNSHVIRYYAKLRLECRRARKRYIATNDRADYLFYQNNRFLANGRLGQALRDAEHYRELGHNYTIEGWAWIQDYRRRRNSIDCD